MELVNGYIYILWNDMYKFYGDNVFKIGRTTDIQKRINCYTTAYINPSEIKYISIKCDNYVLVEMLIFVLIKNNRIVNNREFFKINLNETIKIIDEVIYKINNMKDTINNNVKQNKINNLSMFENILNINHLYIYGITNIKQVDNISEDFFYLITKKFRITTKKPNTIYQAIKLYVHLIKSAISRDIIISKQIKRNNKKCTFIELMKIIILIILKTISN